MTTPCCAEKDQDTFYVALATELQSQVLEGPAGLQPATYGFECNRIAVCIFQVVGGEVIETPSAAYKTAVINQYTNRPLKIIVILWSTERISKPYLQLGRLSH